jgi:hypothetical protein
LAATEYADRDAVARPVDLRLVDSPVFHGYTYGRTWNGWAVPYLPRAEADRLAAYNEAMRAENEEGFDEIRYDPGRDAYDLITRDDVYGTQVVEVGAVMVRTPRGRVRAYPIGAYSYAWETVGGSE